MTDGDLARELAGETQQGRAPAVTGVVNRCPHCTKIVGINQAGVMRPHGPTWQRCPGTHQPARDTDPDQWPPRRKT